MVSRAGKSSLSTTMAQSCSQAKAWVKTHYERNEEGVVAKSVMYKHYEEYCKEQGRSIMETSIFGRVVKSVFPDVTIRRLGGRDNLKYYYCGIWAKETSPYAIDNTTTTRPKRRLRKRELVTEKTEVHNCLRWLHANYVASSEASVVKTDVYEGYLTFCKPRGVEPLSIQYFGMVVIHAFPNVTKRKLGPRTNQQKYYFGIQERPDPMSPEHVPCECLSSIEEVLGSSRAAYRETIENNEEEEEEEEFCRSPELDMSDIAPQHHTLGLRRINFEAEMSTSPHLQYNFDSYLKEDTEPVDYSLSSLRLKDEPIEEEDLMIKEEPLDLHIAREACERRTPDRPPSVSAFRSSNSPSPPSKESRARRIYKPRFHYNDESSWNDDPPPPSTNDKQENENDVTLLSPASAEMQSTSTLRRWILLNLEESKGMHVNRDQVFSLYEKYCDMAKILVLPMTSFDETMLKVFRVVTMIHPSKKTFYEGVRVRETSPLYGRVEELCQEDLHWGEDEANSNNAMELSLQEGTVSHTSPLPLDDEEPPDEGFPFQCAPAEQEEDIPMHTSTEVLRDGKFYLRKWLTDNFHSLPDSCVLKADAYRHYHSYARTINQTPFEMNVFGKIVRQVFPNVSIRRLGGRLKPQYHYCGIAVKNSSPLYLYMSGKDPAQRSRKKEIATDNRSAEIVIDFLRQNYEPMKDKIITKSEVFDNYCSYASAVNENPVTLNYFGKLVKHCFPNIEVRKFGGRSEPTWYYFGLMPKGTVPSQKYSSLYSEESPIKEMSSSVGAGVASQFCLDGEQMCTRHSTSPIPISVQRTHLGASPGQYPGSPSGIPHSHFQTSLRLSSFEDPSHGSPAEHPPYFRESLTPHSPADAFYSRSPVDQSSKGQPQLYHVGHLDGMYHPREASITLHKSLPHLGGGGQVVPSQTPPNMLTLASGVDHAMGVHIHKKGKEGPFAVHEDYENIHDIPME